MNYYRFPDKKPWKIGFLLYLYVLLILTRDSTYTYALWGFEVTQAATIGLILAFGGFFLIWNRKHVKSLLTDQRLIAALLGTALILLPMLLKRDWQMTYFALLLPFYVAVLFTFFTDNREVAKYYVYILLFLAVTSLAANYIVKPIVEETNPSYPYISYNMYRHFHNFYISFPHIWAGYYRNYGIFREPGVYQFFLMLALYLNNYSLNWKKTWQLWTANAVLAATLISTFSTVGLVELCLFAVILFFEKGWHKNSKIRRWVLLGLVISLILVVLILMRYEWLFIEVYEMVEKLFVVTESTYYRLHSITDGLALFFQNPLIGVKVDAVFGELAHNTSSTMIQFGILGFIGGMLNVIAWIALVWKKEKPIWVNIGLLIVLFMSFNTQNLSTNLFFPLIPYMALIERGLPLLKRKKT